MRTNNFDPLAYIESAFLDKEAPQETREDQSSEISDLGMTIPSITDYIQTSTRAKIVINDQVTEEPLLDGEATPKARFRKTVMSAPRPRRARKTSAAEGPAIDPELQSVWQALPKNVAFLCGFYDDSVTKNYYRGEFKETRVELVRRLLDPELSLEETSRLLGVCPATVRRYTNRGWLAHHRTTGGQRRFRLSDIVKFVDEHGRFPEE